VVGCGAVCELVEGGGEEGAVVVVEDDEGVVGAGRREVDGVVEQVGVVDGGEDAALGVVGLVEAAVDQSLKLKK